MKKNLKLLVFVLGSMLFAIILVTVVENQILKYHYRYFKDFIGLENSVLQDGDATFAKQQYNDWYNHKAYSNLLIGLDGHLEDCTDDIDIFDIDMPDFEKVVNGVYMQYGDQYQQVMNISFIDNTDTVGYISITVYDTGENIVSKYYSEFYLQDNGSYKTTVDNLSFKYHNKGIHLDQGKNIGGEYELILPTTSNLEG